MTILGLNLLAYCCQGTLIALAAWALPYMFRVRGPRVLLGHYQVALALALVLPLSSTLIPDLPAASVGLFLTIAGAATNDRSAVVVPQAFSLLAFAWGAGIAVRLLTLMLGFIRLGLYRQRARLLSPLPIVLTDLESRLNVRAEWRVSDEIRGAATFGVRRPIVLLPFAVFDSGDDLPLVACHELLHVRRRDWILVIVEETIRAALWMHPGVWLLLDRIHLHREQVVDDLVIAMTGDRVGYAGALLNGANRDWSVQPAPVSAWLQASHLRARILWIAHGGSMSKAKVWIAAVTLTIGLAVSAVYGVSAFPFQTNARVYDSKEDGIVLPRVIREVKPTYTKAAMEARIEGDMSVSVVVEADGTVGAVSVVRSLDTIYGLDEQGITAAKAWRFRPGTKDGKPVAVRVDLQFTFTLK